MSKFRWSSLLVCASLVIAASGCSTPDTFVDYLSDRRHDLIDAANVNVTALQFGAIAYAGPAQLGFANNMTFGLDNACMGPYYGMWPETNIGQLGLGGYREIYAYGVASGVVWPLNRWNSERSLFGERPRQKPSVTSVGFSLGFLVGIGAEVDVWQALDFALGLFCIDIGGDDHIVLGGRHEIKRPPPGDGVISIGPPALWACTAPYFDKLRTFRITVDEARKKVDEYRESKSIDTAPVGVHLCIIGDFIVFHVPSADGQLPKGYAVNGYYVNGHTGEVEERWDQEDVPLGGIRLGDVHVEGMHIEDVRVEDVYKSE